MHITLLTTLAAGMAVGFLAATGITACTAQGTAGRTLAADGRAPVPAVREVDPADAAAMDRLLDQLTLERVILVGETHDRYDHHLNQLAVIRGLRERGLDLAVGMEFFQAPFQEALDDYVAGRIDEREMLRRTQWYERWRYDYRLYRDILAYAREQGIPLVALNAAGETVARVSAGGVAALDAGERERLGLGPDDDTRALEARLAPIFAAHAHGGSADLGRFVDVQRLWDAHMATTAADYLRAHPGRRLVILAGSGHVVPADAIPGRLARRGFGDSVAIATGPAERYAGGAPDLLFKERDRALDPAGRMGLSLVAGDDGVRVRALEGAVGAGGPPLRAGDRILAIDGQAVRGIGDVRLALLDRRAGESLAIDIARAGGPERLTATITLL
jgi:uncharacterized iron-regulated protein